MKTTRILPPSYSGLQRVDPQIATPTYLPGRGREDREIMPCEEWLKSRYFSGYLWDSFWRDDVRREFCEIVDDPNVEEVILDGSIGWGKSFWARAYITRLIYEVSCLSNPGEFFLGNPMSVISMAMMSVKGEKARSVLFDGIRRSLTDIPYFAREARFNDTWETKRLLTSIKFDDFGLIVKPVVTNIGAVISEDLFAFVLDEANFLPRVQGSRRALDAEAASRAGQVWSAAREFAKKARTRIRSRFLKGGRCWGKMIILSSAIDDNDFTEERRRIAEDAGDLGNRVRYVSKSLWEGKPIGTFSGATFRVDMGIRGRPPRILEEQEHPAGEVIDVPVELKVDFKDDPVLSIRELAGRRSAPTSTWITDPVMVDSMWDRERREPIADVVESGYLDIERGALVVRTRNDWQPLYYPNRPRTIHVDLSSTGDRTGFVMACSPTTQEAEVRDRETGGIATVSVPEIHVDLAVAIAPPRAGRIDIVEIEDQILRLAAMGFDIKLVTFDAYQSERSMQMLEAAGIPTKRLSVDRYPDPYIVLRRAMRLGYVSCPYNEILEDELFTLVESAHNGKVDHPPRGSKDIADALAGVTYAHADPRYLEWAINRTGGIAGLPSIPI